MAEVRDVEIPLWARGGRLPLHEAARACGALTVDGLGMLLHQGALALRLWTGCERPLAAMRRALAVAAAAAGR